MSRRKMNWDRVRTEYRISLQGSERVEPDTQYKAYLADEWRNNVLDERSDPELDEFWNSLTDEMKKAVLEDAWGKHPATERTDAAIRRFRETGIWNP